MTWNSRMIGKFVNKSMNIHQARNSLSPLLIFLIFEFTNIFQNIIFMYRKSNTTIWEIKTIETANFGSGQGLET